MTCTVDVADKLASATMLGTRCLAPASLANIERETVAS